MRWLLLVAMVIGRSSEPEDTEASEAATSSDCSTRGAVMGGPCTSDCYRPDFCGIGDHWACEGGVYRQGTTNCTGAPSRCGRVRVTLGTGCSVDDGPCDYGCVSPGSMARAECVGGVWTAVTIKCGG